MQSSSPSPHSRFARASADAPAWFPRRRRRGRGFTLTELLVVISIIAILVALTAVGVVTALNFAKQTRVKAEVDQLDMAMKAFKEQYGAYPPCDFRALGGLNILKQFVAQAFPRYDLARITPDLKAAGIDYVNFRPDQALVFWLNGFSNDPQNPFVTIDGYQIVADAPNVSKVQTDASGNPVKATRTPLFTFDPERLAHVGNSKTPDISTLMFPAHIRDYPSYFPQGSPTDSTGAPYIYFSANRYSNAPVHPDPPTMPIRYAFNFDNGSAYQIIFDNCGCAVPYALDTNANSTFDLDETWANPDSFQIIAAGSDNKFGVTIPDLKQPARLYPTGVNYDTSPEMTDDDNVTNFSDTARLGDARP